MTPIPTKSAEDRIHASRTWLILDKPFLGALALRLALRQADASWCPTIATDAKSIYYNGAYIESLTNAELQFVISHAALHGALSHFARRGHRVKHRWDLACDYAINPILHDEGLTPPPGAFILDEFRGMSAEEIYPCLSDIEQTETFDQHLFDQQTDQHKSANHRTEIPDEFDSSCGEDQTQSTRSAQIQLTQERADKDGRLMIPPPALSQLERQQLDVLWQQRRAGAEQQARLAGKMSAVLQRLITTHLPSSLPWRTLLLRYLTATAREDYSYARTSSRRGDPALLPVLRSSGVDLLVALDVSGSINDSDIGDCLSEINAVKGQLCARVTVIACDSRVIEGYPKVFPSWEPCQVGDRIAGGGDTDFRPVFDAIPRLEVVPDVVLYFTDGRGVYPDEPPQVPVVWLVKGPESVPWGRRIQLN